MTLVSRTTEPISPHDDHDEHDLGLFYDLEKLEQIETASRASGLLTGTFGRRRALTLMGGTAAALALAA